jgi:co-chaperonin GroES (HSP10)
MSNYLEPANDYCLVVDSSRETTIDGISLPDNMKQQEMVFGTVVFVGPKAEFTKAEDRVCYGPYAGKTVVMDGIEFRMLREGQIEAYVRTRD